LDETSTIFTPQLQLDAAVLVNTQSPPHPATIIGLPSYDKPNIYTVSFPDDSIAEYSTDLIESAPTSSVSATTKILPHWVKGGAITTLFLETMSKPKHGSLYQDSDHNWFFCPGQSHDVSTGVPLPNFVANSQDLLESGQLFRGHTSFVVYMLPEVNFNCVIASSDMCLHMGYLHY
jgi:hypothetical protein